METWIQLLEFTEASKLGRKSRHWINDPSCDQVLEADDARV